MKYMTMWKLRSGQSYKAAVERFMARGQEMPPGVKSLQRWHASDMSCGFHLVEADSASSLMALTAMWVDLMELQVHPVVGDDEAGPIYANSIRG